MALHQKTYHVDALVWTEQRVLRFREVADKLGVERRLRMPGLLALHVHVVLCVRVMVVAVIAEATAAGVCLDCREEVVDGRLDVPVGGLEEERGRGRIQLQEVRELVHEFVVVVRCDALEHLQQLVRHGSGSDLMMAFSQLGRLEFFDSSCLGLLSRHTQHAQPSCNVGTLQPVQPCSEKIPRLRPSDTACLPVHCTYLSCLLAHSGIRSQEPKPTRTFSPPSQSSCKLFVPPRHAVCPSPSILRRAPSRQPARHRS